MKRTKSTEEQIIAILREQEVGAKTAEVCRRHGIGGATFYAWKAKLGGMELSEAKRRKALKDENTELNSPELHGRPRIPSSAAVRSRRATASRS